MTFSARPSPSAGPSITYARARLLLGVAGVGTSVIAALAILALDLPSRLLSTSASQPLLEALISVLLLLALAALAFLPFDVLGGAVIVRQRAAWPTFLARWLRGVLLQWFIWALSIALLIWAARAGGNWLAFAAFALLQFALAALRGSFALGIAHFRELPLPERAQLAAQRAGIAAERILLLDATDEGFVGGWSGIAARKLLLPARWLELPESALVATLQRRRIVAESGAHRRGVLGAIIWNSLGFALVITLSGAALSTAAGVLTMAAAMTLWAFVGVLLLPTPSRAAVFALDRAAASEAGVAAVTDAIERLDRWQDDEERRSPGVETIFHPVPSRAARLERLSGAALHRETKPAMQSYHAHHLARHALWLGWATLSPISRAVHCNVGRPSLWAMLPGD